MPFWSDASVGVRDPKRQFRWIATIGSIPAFTLKKVTKPSFNVLESQHKFLNHTYYYPGRVEWQEISVTLADPVDPDMASTVISIVRAAGYAPARSAQDLNTMSKSKAVAALQGFAIEQLDSDGNFVESWTLVNPWVKDVKFGDLDYEGDDLTDVELTIRYDWASLSTATAASSTAPNPSTGPNDPYFAFSGVAGS